MSKIMERLNYWRVRIATWASGAKTSATLKRQIDRARRSQS